MPTGQDEDTASKAESQHTEGQPLAKDNDGAGEESNDRRGLPQGEQDTRPTSQRTSGSSVSKRMSGTENLDNVNLDDDVPLQPEGGLTRPVNARRTL